MSKQRHVSNHYTDDELLDGYKRAAGDYRRLDLIDHPEYIKVTRWLKEHGVTSDYTPSSGSD